MGKTELSRLNLGDNLFKKLFSILFLFTLFFSQLSLGLAEEETPTVINAESLVIEMNENKATFLGGVKAVQAEGTLESRELQVIFNKDEEEIDKLIAKGKVKITQGNNIGTCEEAIYEFSPKRKVIMKGNPHLKQGKQKFSGEVITFLLDEERVIIKQKVRGVVFPQKKKEGILPKF